MKIRFKGVTPEMAAGVFLLILAVTNAISESFGVHPLPVKNEEIYRIVSALLLILTTLWNTWKNRNLSSASQTAQKITDAIKQGEILEKDINAFLEQFKQ